MSFRKKLLFFAVTLILTLAIPLAVLQVSRPWTKLQELIARSRARLDGIIPAIEQDDLLRMSTFAIEVAPHLRDTRPRDLPEENYRNWANSQAFYLLLDRGSLPEAAELQKIFKKENLVYTDFSYDLLRDWYRYWSHELEKRPGMLEIFKHYRKMLRGTHVRADQAKSLLSDLYLMVDMPASHSDLFKNHMVFLLESLPWWGASSPGEAYDLVETDTMHWRASLNSGSGDAVGFHHNKVCDSSRWFLPRFNTDEWGTWFTVWYALPSTGVRAGEPIHNIINIDFDASEVKKLMLLSAVQLGIVALLLTVLLVVAVRSFSAWLTRPIDALVVGAEAVMRQDYEHRIPQFGNDEFQRLIEVFNCMAVWVKERVNMRQALARLLSEELAEQAGREGLILGGQRVRCTILFTDFAGFSTLTRHMSATEVVGLLNLYFGELIPLVKYSGGFPDKYIGDAIVAIFGAPVPLPDHETRAVRCAVQMQQRLRQLNDVRRLEGLPVFEMRLGISSGEVVAGAIGCDLKLEYTSIGETTNLANGMEAVCAIGQVCMTNHTWEKVSEEEKARHASRCVRSTEHVKGYADSVQAVTIRVHDLCITKNPGASRPEDFYQYGPLPRPC